MDKPAAYVRLSEREIDQARKAFLEFDKDHSGSIDQVCVFFHFAPFVGCNDFVCASFFWWKRFSAYFASSHIIKN